MGCCICLGLLTGCRAETDKGIKQQEVNIPERKLMISPDSLTPLSDTDTVLWEYNHQLIPMNYIESPEPFPAFKEIRLE